MADRPKMGVEVNMRSDSSSTKPASLSTPSTNAVQTQADSPFCIAVMGDFSGRTHQPDLTTNDTKRRLIEVDRDNFDEVMAKFKINLPLDLSTEENTPNKTSQTEIIQVSLNELDDFHPDELYEKLESFEKLRSLRRRLKNNKSFAEAAAEVQSWLPAEETIENTRATSNQATSSPTPSSPAASAEPVTDNLLDSILGSSQSQSHAAVETTQIDKLIKSIVAPYVESAADPRQNDMLDMLDRATESHMQRILHHPSFQALESAWQSLYFLIKRIETGAKLKIFILDISKQELQQDLSADDLSSSSIYKLFCDTSEGDTPLSVLLGNYTFSDNIEDALSLANMGSIAQQANAPFIAAAHEKLAGCEAFSKSADYEDWNYTASEGATKAWALLRQSAVASYIALALPRFLLRLPYGSKSKPIDAFKFEEMTEENRHGDYLWGNPAFIKTECLAQSFKSNGWNMQICELIQTDNLPVHYYSDEGETVSKPIAEIMLTEKGGEILNQHGLISLWSVRNADCIRSADYHAIHANQQQLAGRWR